MPQPWTSKLIIKALGVQKCNGGMDSAVEDLPLEKAIEVARESRSWALDRSGLESTNTRGHRYLRVHASQGRRSLGS